MYKTRNRNKMKNKYCMKIEEEAELKICNKNTEKKDKERENFSHNNMSIFASCFILGYQCGWNVYIYCIWVWNVYVSPIPAILEWDDDFYAWKISENGNQTKRTPKNMWFAFVIEDIKKQFSCCFKASFF